MKDIDLHLAATRAEIYTEGMRREIAKALTADDPSGLFAVSRSIEADGSATPEPENLIWFWTPARIIHRPPAVIDDAGVLARAGAATFLSFEQAIFAHEAGIAASRMHSPITGREELRALCHPAGIIVLKRNATSALVQELAERGSPEREAAIASCAAVVLDSRLSNHATLEALMTFERFLEMHICQATDSHRHRLTQTFNEEVKLRPRLRLE